MSKYSHMLPERSHAVPGERRGEVTSVSDKTLPLPAPSAIVQRAALAQESLRPVEVVRIQQTLGNRAVGELLGRASWSRHRIQAKLTVNAPGDEYEREADRVAWQVMHMPAGRATNVEKDDVPMVTQVSAVQRAGEGVVELDGEFERQLTASRPGGQSLPPAIRQEFEPRFDADFSEVRVHADAQSDALNRAVGARALTNGQDIFFRQGAYAPGSEAGRALLAHELTHVEQQGGAGINRRQRPAGVAAAHIQAQWDFQNPDFATTQAIVPLKDDFLVLKLTDNSQDQYPDNTCILKGEAVSTSTAIEHLTQEFARSVMPNPANVQVANVSSPAYWVSIRQAINRCMNPTDAAKAIKALEDAFMPNGVQTGHLSMMSVAPGEATSAVAPRQEQNYRQTILVLLNNPEYLRDLGRLAALDVYTLQPDRVLGGNLGNWMTDVAGGRVSALIDNTDRQNVNYFLGNMNPDLDNFSVMSGGKVKLDSTAAQAKHGALDTAIWNIFRGIARESGGAFTSINQAFDWVRNPSSQDLNVTNYQYFYGHMAKGWDDGVARLKGKVTTPGWKGAINKRITEGREQVPHFLIERLIVRNRVFLGLTKT
jgi:hypothetical protein